MQFDLQFLFISTLSLMSDACWVYFVSISYLPFYVGAMIQSDKMYLLLLLFISSLSMAFFVYLNKHFIVVHLRLIVHLLISISHCLNSWICWVDTDVHAKTIECPLFVLIALPYLWTYYDLSFYVNIWSDAALHITQAMKSPCNWR